MKHLFIILGVIESITLMSIPVVMNNSGDIVAIFSSIVTVVNMAVIYRLYSVCAKKKRRPQVYLIGLALAYIAFSLLLVVMLFITKALLPRLIITMMYGGLLGGLFLFSFSFENRILKVLAYKLVNWNDFKF